MTTTDPVITPEDALRAALESMASPDRVATLVDVLTAHLGGTIPIALAVGDRMFAVDVSPKRSSTADDVVRKLRGTTEYRSPLLPRHVRAYVENGGNARLLVEIPPRVVDASLQSSIQLPHGLAVGTLRLLVPFTVYVIVVRNQRYASHTAFFRPAAITSLDDRLHGYCLPNMYSVDEGRPCLGTSDGLSTLTDLAAIVQYVDRAHRNSAYNNDLLNQMRVPMFLQNVPLLPEFTPTPEVQQWITDHAKTSVLPLLLRWASWSCGADLAPSAALSVGWPEAVVNGEAMTVRKALHERAE